MKYNMDMYNRMEGLLNKADDIIDKSHEKLINGGFRDFIGHPLHKKLAEIYAEEGNKLPRVKNIFLTHRLLERLVKRDNLNCLIVNLYKGNDGYSLAVKLPNGVETETVRLPYEHDEFLSYLDNEQLPPMLLDLLDDANVEIFHQGCIIAEVRDFRRSLDAMFDSKFILLRPTNQSIAADIASMTRNGSWTAEEKLKLESEIILRTAPTLNLNPDPIVAVINNKLHRHKYKFSDIPLKRAAKRFSQVAQNRQKVFEEGPCPKSLKLLSFLSEKKGRRPIPKVIPKPMIPLASSDVEILSGDLFANKVPSGENSEFYNRINEDVKRVSQPLERHQETTDNSLVFIEEYTLETERGQGPIYLKLTISQRRTDEIYFGELYVDIDYQEGKNNGSICKFQLGTLHQVQRYIKQFKEILTEEGRKSVKITHKVAGQPPRVALTQGTKDTVNSTSTGSSNSSRITSKKEMAQQLHDHQLQVNKQLQQGLITSFNLGVQQPINSTTPVTLAQTAPQNVIIVSNAGDSVLKKTLSIVNKPITVTSNASLSTLLSAQNTVPGTNQQVVLGRSVNLTNLLGGRQVVTGGTGPGRTIQAQNITTLTSQGQKLTGNIINTGNNVVHTPNKISLPTLAAQLNRPSPAYSQVSKSQSIISHLPTNDSSIKISDTGQPPPLPPVRTSLQALLAGTVNAVNPAAARCNASIIEKLAAQSVMLNSSKHDDSIKQHTVQIGGNSNVSSSHHISHQPSVSSIVTAANTVDGNPTAPPGSIFYKADSLGGSAPPNISLSNIANLPGLNVGLQNLAQNLQGIQNVQVSFPGFTVPISLSINMTTTTTTLGQHNIVTSASPIHSKGGNIVTSATPTVMIANPSGGLTQGQVVQLPLSQLGSPQLAAQLSKGNQGGVPTSSIPVLQVQGMGGSLFTSVRSMNHQSGLQPVTIHQAGGLGGGIGSIQAHPVQVATPSQSITTSLGDLGNLGLVSSAPPMGSSSIVTLTSKQPTVQLAMAKQPSGQLTWQLQQKLMATKRQQQQHHQQQPK